jgi:hypothetical protein
MKHVVSVSLGSSQRDKTFETEILGLPFRIERVGVDGSLEKYAAKLEELDGKVDAIGIGGMDVYIHAGGKRYVLRDPAKLVSRLKQTPWVDGSGLKHTLERETVRRLQTSGVVNWSGTKVLMVSAVDRFGMAEALHEAGADLCVGDVMFILGLPVPLRTWRGFQRVALTVIPYVVKAPFKWLYPTGKKQESVRPKWPYWYRWAEVIAGDFLLIRRHMPDDLAGKIILTNTTTEADHAELKKRGVSKLITTTPVFDGRSFGTNVLEAVLIAAAERKPEDLTEADYLEMLKRLGWEPGVIVLNADPPSP